MERLSLDSISVVVTAKHHNPSILNPDFLERNGIVPVGWVIVDNLTTQAFSLVRYDNGVEWHLDPLKAILTETSELAVDGSRRIPSIITSWLRQLPHVPYHDLGFSWKLSVRQPAARDWLMDHFFRHDTPSNRSVSRVQPRFTIDADGKQLNLALDERESTDGDQVEVKCSLYFRGLDDSVKMQQEIGEWEKHESLIFMIVGELFEE